MNKQITKSVDERLQEIRPWAKRFTKPSRTKQQFKEEADIHNILKKYREVGVWGDRFRTATRVAYQGDFTTVKDYQEACNIVIKANQSFQELPSRIRERFKNDPAQLLAFLNDENNYEEGVKLGIFEAKQTEGPSPSEAPKVDLE